MAATADQGDELISAINVTPLVDVFLVLLIIFMVTANLFLEQERRLREIPLTLPAAASGARPEPKPVLVTILLDHAGAVYLDGAPSDLATVGQRLAATTRGTVPPEVVLSADKDLPYGRVAGVIDFVKQHGVAHFAINVEEQTLWAGTAR
jgi:biopolymer transport protein ExbD